jgi:hypothetical protein
MVTDYRDVVHFNKGQQKGANTKHFKMKREKRTVEYSIDQWEIRREVNMTTVCATEGRWQPDVCKEGKYFAVRINTEATTREDNEFQNWSYRMKSVT